MLPLIRAATPEDGSSILALMTAVIRATVDDAYQSDTIENVFSNLEYWKNNSDRCVHLVAEIDSSVVGVILVKEFWNLCSLFVAVEQHRQGVGRALTEKAIITCRGQSPIDAIFLNSSPFAVEFYTALGFGPRKTNQVLHPGVEPMKYDFVAREA
jgi:predicted N-acetyltransferase YhbS